MKRSGILFLLIISIIIISGCTSKVPLTSSEVAKCLASSGAKMYGTSTCSDCEDQKAHFGGDFKDVPYVECDTTGVEECAKAGITTYPTWVFGDGQKLSGVQYLDKLSAMANCEIKNPYKITETKEQTTQTPKGTTSTIDNSKQGNILIKSIYEGTYEGKLEYEYNPATMSYFRTLPEGKKYLACETGWVPTTLTLRIKFGSIPEHDTEGNDHFYSARDRYDAKILNIWIDDPDFGTGPNGYEPINSIYTMPWLPRDPSDPAHKAIYEEGKSSETYWDMVVDIYEDPNNKQESSISKFSLTGTTLNPSGFYVSDDAKVLHSNPIPHEDYMGKEAWSAYQNTWYAYAESGSGPLSSSKHNENACDVRFKTWTLTKISD